MFIRFAKAVIALLDSLDDLLINQFPNSIGVIAEGCEIRCAEYTSAFGCQLFKDYFVGHLFTNLPHEFILCCNFINQIIRTTLKKVNVQGHFCMLNGKYSAKILHKSVCCSVSFGKSSLVNHLDVGAGYYL